MQSSEKALELIIISEHIKGEKNRLSMDPDHILAGSYEIYNKK